MDRPHVQHGLPRTQVSLRHLVRGIPSMRLYPLSLFLLPLFAVLPLQAQDLATTCHATSSYDVTLRPGSVLFDRPSPAPTRVELGQGTLRTDGVAVPLNAEEQDRLSLFERDLRALAPRVHTVAQHGVDIAVQGLREEAAGMGLGADTRAQLDQRLAADAASLKQRIAASNSTHDWQGGAMDQYVNQIESDLLPLITADLGQQARPRHEPCHATGAAHAPADAGAAAADRGAVSGDPPAGHAAARCARQQGPAIGLAADRPVSVISP